MGHGQDLYEDISKTVLKVKIKTESQPMLSGRMIQHCKDANYYKTI